MNYLSVEAIGKSYGERTLFNNLSFGLSKGQKMALVARNGTGKTTLMRILTGLEAPDSGEVVFRKELQIGYLDQDPDLPADKTIASVLYEADNVRASALREYEKLVAEEADGDALHKALETMDRLQAWDYEARSEEILGKLAIDRTDRVIGILSGGQRKRVALAKLLIDSPDLLILDEPTNHLDIAMVEWLETFLSQDHLTVFMVTHDRYFLDRVCDEIVEIEGGGLQRYRGNYSYYLEKREERHEATSSEIGKARSLMKTELEWVRRMPKARGTKSKARLDAFEKLRESASRSTRENEVQLEIKMNRLGGKILESHHLRKSYGDLKIVDDFSYKFQTRDRVGIIGPNGAGKTTLINLFLGLEDPDGGKVVAGETVIFGYYKQDGLKFSDEKRVIEVVKDIAEVIPLNKGRKLTASQLLERFLFPTHSHYTFVGKLSGGEKRRLYLLTILMANPNFLILDEPTNDLDILTLNILEDFLEDFQGCLLIVSHDRYFMDKLVDHLFVLEGNGKIKDFPGHYSHYREYLLVQEEASRNAPKTIKAAKKESKPAPTNKVKLTYKERLEYEQLEKEIEQLEGRKEKLTEQLNSGESDHEKLLAIGQELSEVIEAIESKGDRWLVLAEFA